VHTLLKDLKFGVRMMGRTPVVTLVAVLSLALAVAANAAMFALLNGFLLEPFPYDRQDELALYRTLRQDQGGNLDMAGGVAVGNFRDYVAASPSVVGWTIYDTEAANLTGLDTPEQLLVVRATPSIFDVLGVQPALGRGFRAEEGVEGAGQVLVLHHDFWQRRFLGDLDVLGRAITVDGTVYTIVGVMPEEFDLLPANVQAFRPTDFADAMESRGDRGYTAIARLRPGTTAAQAQLEIEGVHARLTAEHPEALRSMDVVVTSLREFFPGSTDRQLIALLTAVTLFGLLIACANVANLLLGRAEERQREVALRTAIGAGRGRILRQLLTESVLMGAVAGAIGLVLSVWIVGWLRSAMPPMLPAAVMPELDPEVVLATLAVSMAAGVVFGMAPALHAVAGNLREALGNGARGGTAGRRRKRLRSAFVIGEVAVALGLLAGSGFLMEAFDSITNDDPGFEAEGLLAFQLSVLEDRYPDDAAVVAYERELLRALEALPGVEAAAAMSSLPRSDFGNPTVRYTIDGRPPLDAAEQPVAGIQSVSAGYFETLRIELRRGRLLEDTDRADAPPVAVVSEAFAAREFPGEDPLGRRVTVRGSSREIVGVVENIVQERIRLAGTAGEQIYLPLDQAPLRAPAFAARVEGDPAALAAAVRGAVWSVEADQPIASLQPLQAYIDASLAGPQAIAIFLTAMGILALLLAAMGIYGVMAHSVVQQQRDIGIRMALGARRGAVVGALARSGLTLVAVGVALGLPLAFLMLRGTAASLSLFSTEVGLGYPLALGGALVVVAVLATVVPAGRASGVTPVVALRE
jgi:putative ABC transport system permease protein